MKIIFQKKIGRVLKKADFKSFNFDNLKWFRILTYFVLCSIISLIFYVYYLKLKGEVTNPSTSIGLFIFLLIFGVSSQLIKLVSIYLFYFLTIKYIAQLVKNFHIKIILMILYGVLIIYIAHFLWDNIEQFTIKETSKKTNYFFLIFSSIYILQINIWYLRVTAHRNSSA